MIQVYRTAKNAKGKVYRLAHIDTWNDGTGSFYVQTLKSSYNGKVRGGLDTRWVYSDKCATLEEAERAFAKRTGAKRLSDEAFQESIRINGRPSAAPFQR